MALMRLRRIASGTLLSVLALIPAGISAQTVGATIRARVEAARTAAAQDHQFLFRQLCSGPIEAVNATPAAGEAPGTLPATDPERDWYTEPVQVFDDLFYLGQTAYSVWGLRTSEGIVLLDAIFDYSVEAEVIEGLRKLGIDPSEIRYVIVSHAHGDHSAGAGILQKQYGARVVMSEADWDLYESSGREPVKATRDVVATDGMEIRLGDAVVRTYLTPGHTLGTISTVITVHDNGQPHVAALWGGTAFNFRDLPGDPRDGRLRLYAESAQHFRDITTRAGADIILSNHPTYDGSAGKVQALAQRRSGAPHPYVIGANGVSRYLTVAQECAVAARLAEGTAVIF
jgi:metallo-beta-lactamase class B